MNATNQLCEQLIGTYTDFEPITEIKKFRGYKLVEKKNLNYYSIATGMFRYRPKNVSQNSYHALYEREQKHFTSHLVNRVAIFENQEDAYNAFIEFKELADYKIELVMLELIISQNLEFAFFTNKNVSMANVIIGGDIDSIKEISSEYDNIHIS